MTISAFAWLLFVCELSQAESACVCPSSDPACEGDGRCYRRGSNSWSWKGLSCGSCTSSYASSSHKLQRSGKHQGKCYSYFGSSKTWCYTQKKGGAFATSGCASYNGYGEEWCCPDKFRCKRSPAPAPPPTPKNKLRDSAKGSAGRCYSYYGSGHEWCYTKKKDGSYAHSNCKSYDGYHDNWCCPNKYKCHEAGGSSCNPSGLGKYIAKFVKSKKGVKVYSDKQGSASCWDLAWGAMEQAKKDGYSPVFYQQVSNWADSYAWSSEVVPITQARPGDIAQFKGWTQKYKWAGNPHTAVVTECYKDGALTTYEQNPGVIAEGKYYPHQKTEGSVTIYRLKSNSRLRLYSQMPQLSDLGLHSGQLSVLAAFGAITGLLAIAVKQRRSVAPSGFRSIEEDTMLYPEMLDPEFAEEPPN